MRPSGARFPVRRMRHQVGKLRTYLRRVARDIERKIADYPDQQAIFADELALAKRLLRQKKTDSNKLYSLHAPEVECISKGKAHKCDEFDMKASIAATHRRLFLVGGMALPGNPFDGHTLVAALAQVRRLTGSRIDVVFVDHGYRGHGEQAATVYIAGQKRGVKTQRLRRSMKRRQAIEPSIGHLKSDGLLGRNYLKGTVGDQMKVTLSCAEHNLRLILRHLRNFLLGMLDAAVRTKRGTHPMGCSKPLVNRGMAERNLRWHSINAPTSPLVPIS